MVLHPDEKCRSSQAKFLTQCPSDQRRLHELLFSYGNSAYIYHQQAKEFEPTVNDYEEWLEGLKEPIQKEMKKQGFDRCKNILSFTRYVLEKNDVGMEEFIKEQMGMEEYSEYKTFV